MTDYDAIIIGGGAAGLSAAVMLGRARRRTLVLDGGEPRNRFSSHLHGVLGQEGVDPGRFLAAARDEVVAYGVETAVDEVAAVSETRDEVRVELASGSSLTARALVVASGMVDELPDIPGLAERWGVSVLHCPYCHGWEVRGSRLGVLATSPLSLHQTQLVRQWSDDVTVFTAKLGVIDMAAEFRLRARGMRLVAAEVVEVGGTGREVEWVLTSAGERIALDALFVAPTPRPRDGFLDPLGLDRSELPFGSFLAVDATGRTSWPRIWAAGNVVNPGATVAVAMGAGAQVGGAVNGALVAEDFDRAANDRGVWPEIAPLDYWEHRYAGPHATWSGRVNAVLAEVAADLRPGRALDLGCGEGADVIWLAQRGWSATGIDISPSAIRRAQAAAAAAEVDGRAVFRVGDLAVVSPAERFDLVSASFLHSPVDLPREEILRRATSYVAPGGRLLITSHVALPRHADLPAALAPRFLTPEEELASLRLETEEWEVEICEVRDRSDAAEGAQPSHLRDSIVLIRRRHRGDRK